MAAEGFFADWGAGELAVQPINLAAILAMGLATYVTRAGGFLLMRWVPQGGRVEAWLKAVPGAVLMAIVAPALLTHGLAGALAIGATLLVMRTTRQDLLAVGAGVLTVALARQLGL
ncbi:MAG: AzlD domain-containing protein [Tistlia sp.]|uniref:AzlD family protein n=1 Tax=Tistlia sp. TaxID=3057121 RepID=UPI0034A25CC9